MKDLFQIKPMMPSRMNLFLVDANRADSDCHQRYGDTGRRQRIASDSIQFSKSHTDGTRP